MAEPPEQAETVLLASMHLRQLVRMTGGLRGVGELGMALVTPSAAMARCPDGSDP